MNGSNRINWDASTHEEQRAFVERARDYAARHPHGAVRRFVFCLCRAADLVVAWEATIDRCVLWVRSNFGEAVLNTPRERAMRVLEEATELAQSEGVTAAEADGIRARVYSRPEGDAAQEAAGLYFTLLVWARVRGVDLRRELVRELDRVEDPALSEKIRRKHLDKVAAGIGVPINAE